MSSCRSEKWRTAASLLLTAMALSGLTLTLQSVGTLGWLDSLSLRLAGAASVRDTAMPFNQQHPPLSIVDIDRRVYRECFDERSPLDRATLANIILQIARRHPAVLAIDIDISPTVSETPQDREKLDGALRFAQNNDIALVIATPGTVAGNPTAAQQAWMSRLRTRGSPARVSIEFASSNIAEHLGMVVDADAVPDSLVITALALGHQLNARPAPGDPILPAALDPLIQAALSWTLRTGPNHGLDAVPPAFDAPIVLLGGSFDPLDRFSTVLGPMSGLHVHAATLLSVQRRGGPTLPLKFIRCGEYLIEILAGLLLGRMWRETWHWYESFARRAPGSGRATKVREFMLAWLLLSIFALSVVVPGFIVLRVAAWFLTQGVWLNPSPLLIGMVIDAIRTPYGERDEHERSWPALVNQSVDRLLVRLPLAIAGVVFLIFSRT